jgi:hypothetical protein
VRLRKHSVVMLALAVACAGTNDICVPPPCPPSFAIVTTIRSATGLAIPTAFVDELDASGAVTQTTNCGDNSCLVGFEAGTYRLRIGAPGFMSRDTTVNVTAPNSRPCSCQFLNTQQLTVTLILVPPPGV